MDHRNSRVVSLMRLSRIRQRAVFVSLLCVAAGALAQPAEILPSEKIVAGMKGYGVSDLGDGKGVQRFQVEMLGLLKRFAPKQDLILARVSGIGLENSGII